MRSKLLLSIVCGSSSLFAASSVLADCCPNNPAMWEIGFTGYWLQPNTDFTQFGTSTNALTGLSGPASGTLVKNQPKHILNYGVNVGYRFCESLSNLNFTYQWGSNNSTGSLGGTAVGTTVLPPADGFSVARSASSEFRYRFKFGNIELGAFYCLCNELSINPQVGISYYNTRNVQTVTYSDVIAIAGRVTSIHFRSNFNGYGPSLGLGLAYPLCWGFSIVSNNRYSALIGSTVSHTKHFNTFGGGFLTLPSWDVGTTSKRTIVSLLQTELGLAYAFNLVCDYSGKVVLGYQIKKAFDSIERFNFAGDTGSSVSFLDFKKFNAGDSGPFLRLAVAF